jgi:beta-lactam-binding protein with PASTA domain
VEPVRFRTSFVVAAVVVLAGCGGSDVERAPARTTHFSLNDIDVVGLTLAAATARLEARGWSEDDRGTSGGAYSVYPEAPQWIVCSQRFSPLANGLRDLHLDAAPTCGEVEMPNLIGKTYEDAEEAAEILGMSVFEEMILPDDGGVICSQSPPPGQFVRSEEDTIFIDRVSPSCR